MTLTLQAGKFYRTRDGRKVWIAGRSPFPCAKPWLGAMDENVAFVRWTDAGFWFSSGQNCAEDLIAEWTEPRSGEVWVNVYGHAQVPFVLGGSYVSRIEADAMRDRTQDCIACIRVPWTEGQFDD